MPPRAHDPLLIVPVLEPTGQTYFGRPIYELASDAMLSWGPLYVRVPRGQRTDGPSVPWPLCRWTWLMQQVMFAAVVHDYLYGLGTIPRWFCDAILVVAMKLSGVPWPLRQATFLYVRLFGWLRYRATMIR